MNPAYSCCTWFVTTPRHFIKFQMCFKKNPTLLHFCVQCRIEKEGTEWTLWGFFLNGTFLKANELIKLTSHKVTVVCCRTLPKQDARAPRVYRTVQMKRPLFREACRLFAPSLLTRLKFVPGDRVRSGTKWVSWDSLGKWRQNRNRCFITINRAALRWAFNKKPVCQPHSQYVYLRNAQIGFSK